jgi:hypothetical protein
MRDGGCGPHLSVLSLDLDSFVHRSFSTRWFRTAPRLGRHRSPKVKGGLEQLQPDNRNDRRLAVAGKVVKGLLLDTE